MEKIEFMSSLLAFFVKGEITGNTNFVSFQIPNLMCGFIPAGTRKENLAVHQISSTATNYGFALSNFLVGLWMLLVALASLIELNIIIFVLSGYVGASILLSAFKYELIVNTTSGKVIAINFFIFEKEKAQIASERINSMIVNHMDDTNVRTQTDRIIDAMKN